MLCCAAGWAVSDVSMALVLYPEEEGMTVFRNASQLLTKRRRIISQNTCIFETGVSETVVSAQN
jgi:hypothetical protein